MKFLLIIYNNDSYISFFPQGMAYLAGALLENKNEVEIFDMAANNYTLLDLQKHIEKHNYNYVCLGFCGGYYQYDIAIKLSNHINLCNNRKTFKYILGGHGPSPEPKYFLELLKANIVVIGEGEETIKEIANGKPLNYIDGICYKDNWTEEIAINKERKVIKDVDKISFPAYHLFDINYYKLYRKPKINNKEYSMPILSARGCLYKCTFCYRLMDGYRTRSTENIIKEIKYLKNEYNITYIVFSDELFMGIKSRTEEICKAIIQENLNIKFSCDGRLNIAAKYYDLLQLMKKAGCQFINYGIESLNNKVLKSYKKGLTKDIIIKGVENTLNVGISPGLNIIWGNEFDTKENLFESVNFLLKYDDQAQLRTIRPVTPYPGSPLYHEALNKGLLENIKDFYNKHNNSDLLTVNFTKLSDEEFYKNICIANKILIANYYKIIKSKHFITMDKLYSKEDINFRGFRQ